MCDVEIEKYEGFAQFAEIQQFAEDTAKLRKCNISGQFRPLYTSPHSMLGPMMFEIIGESTLLTGLLIGCEYRILGTIVLNKARRKQLLESR